MTTVDGEHVRRSAVARLLELGRPSAVLRAVVAVIVDAVETVLGRRARTHVLEEGFEGVPPFAHLDAAATVAGVGVVALVAATLAHPAPGPVLWCALPHDRAPVSQDALTVHGSPCASALIVAEPLGAHGIAPAAHVDSEVTKQPPHAALAATRSIPQLGRYLAVASAFVNVPTAQPNVRRLGRSDIHQPSQPRGVSVRHAARPSTGS